MDTRARGWKRSDTTTERHTKEIRNTTAKGDTVEERDTQQKVKEEGVTRSSKNSLGSRTASGGVETRTKKQFETNTCTDIGRR